MLVSNPSKRPRPPISWSIDWLGHRVPRKSHYTVIAHVGVSVGSPVTSIFRPPERVYITIDSNNNKSNNKKLPTAFLVGPVNIRTYKVPPKLLPVV